MCIKYCIINLIPSPQIVNEEVEFDIILTTYNMVISSADDRVLFRKLDFHYVIFDEAHMLKNMATSRYENLMRVRASRKLLLTGTPLQNNLIELMSLLVFVMPDMFANKKEQVREYTVETGRGYKVQGDSGGLRLGWVDLDFECSTILLGQ